MTDPIPNSPEFAALPIERQRQILEARATEIISFHRQNCVCEKCRGPQPWYYEPDDARALERWQAAVGSINYIKIERN
jgi:hypothetical protein